MISYECDELCIRIKTDEKGNICIICLVIVTTLSGMAELYMFTKIRIRMSMRN